MKYKSLSSIHSTDSRFYKELNNSIQFGINAALTSEIHLGLNYGVALELHFQLSYETEKSGDILSV